MCGIIHLGGQVIEIFCHEIDPDWWRHPWPPVDLTQIGWDGEAGGPQPDPWRVELTKLGDVLATAGHLRDAEQADRLGAVVVEVGNAIAEQARANVRFEWASHAG
ncbi:hypothetical protein AB0425_28230 [Actinosynnema sp. NPDC051121]